MSAITIDLRIAEPAWGEDAPYERLALEAISAACAQLEDVPSGEVALLLTDDAQMHELNATWRGKDAPTDVLSFPADPADAGFLGDIALGLGVCRSDAGEQARPLDAHISHLIMHGFLHLLGFDHETEAEAEEMEAVEIAALASLGLPDPYSQRT